MSFQLVIAEKPSVARSIAAVIGASEKQTGYWQGGGYLVSWCIGHLVSFAEAGRYDEKYCKWKYEDLPILPQLWKFIVPDEKKQQFEIVRTLLNRPDVDSVTAATDAGREGELIFRFVYQMAGCTKPVKRLWISSISICTLSFLSRVTVQRICRWLFHFSVTASCVPIKGETLPLQGFA